MLVERPNDELLARIVSLEVLVHAAEDETRRSTIGDGQNPVTLPLVLEPLVLRGAVTVEARAYDEDGEIVAATTEPIDDRGTRGYCCDLMEPRAESHYLKVAPVEEGAE